MENPENTNKLTVRFPVVPYRLTCKVRGKTGKHKIKKWKGKVTETGTYQTRQDGKYKILQLVFENHIECSRDGNDYLLQNYITMDRIVWDINTFILQGTDRYYIMLLQISVNWYKSEKWFVPYFLNVVWFPKFPWKSSKNHFLMSMVKSLETSFSCLNFLSF